MPTLQKIKHSIRQPADTVEVFFTLLSLPLYMVEEVERIFYGYSKNTLTTGVIHGRW